MEFLGQLSLITHIVAGAVMLLSAPFAFIINVKSIKNHRLAGKIFNYAMTIVGITTVIGVFKRPDNLFSYFLLAIMVLTAFSVVKGVRAIQVMKGSPINKVDYINLAFIGVSGLFLLGAATYVHFFNLSGEVTILFGVFGLVCLAEIYPSLKRFKNPKEVNWFRVHIGSMMGAFIASTTAFVVNALKFLPFLVQWFGPTVVLVPLIIYYQRKFAPKKKGQNA